MSQKISSEKEQIMNNILDVNMTKWRTCFSSISYYGYKLDILKSGVQKYLRRREFDKMVWCVAEIYLFQVLQTTEQHKKATKGIISNLLNRLIVMMDEEMLFAECDTYLMIRRYMEMFEKGKRGDFSMLFKICHLLCKSRMLRRNSDIRAYFKHAMMNENSGIEPPASIIDAANFSEQEVDKFYFENFKAYFKMEDKNEAVKCYYWMFKIFMGKRDGNVRRFRRKENIYMIWEFLFSRKNIMSDPRLKKCLEYRLGEFHKKSRGERFIFLTASIDIALFQTAEFDFNMNLEKWLDGNSGDWGWSSPEEIIDKVYKNRVYMEMDDYVVDMHCSLGRKLGKGKKDFAIEGSLVVEEDKQFYVKEWRKRYNSAKCKPKVKKSKKKKAKAEEKVEKKEKKKKTAREIERAEKYKMIKKMRGKPNFDDLEKDLDFIDAKNIDVDEIKLCTDLTCGNKVMCFEYEGKIWKEGRKSMHYNRDYCVLDECKELFGLEKIGMKRVLSNFRLERSDRSKKSWVDNWKKVSWGPCVGDNKDAKNNVVYCVMDKVEPGEEIGKHKKRMLANRKLLKEFAKIGVFRGIFRVSDFNGRNVLTKGEDKLVSIDEGDIGKRLDIIGGREKWLIGALNKDKTIINEILNELTYQHTKIIMSLEMMERYKFGFELINEVENNWKNLKSDLIKEGIEF